jgi:hypothetical protein
LVVAKKQAQTQSSATNNEQLLQLAISAAKKGNKEGARVMFKQVYDRDKRSERALYGMAQVAKNARERRQWVDRLLKVNPGHEGGLAMMKKLQYQSAAGENRTLLIGGVIVLVLIIVIAAIFVLLTSVT